MIKSHEVDTFVTLKNSFDGNIFCDPFMLEIITDFTSQLILQSQYCTNIVILFFYFNRYFWCFWYSRIGYNYRCHW